MARTHRYPGGAAVSRSFTLPPKLDALLRLEVEHRKGEGAAVTASQIVCTALMERYFDAAGNARPGLPFID